jgi:hypothetical protein
MTSTELNGSQTIVSREATELVVSREATELLAMLAQRRFFLRYTVRELTDAQAAEQTTASALCLGGLIKHVADTERTWVDFIVRGPVANELPEDWQTLDHSLHFRMLPGETLTGLLAEYEDVARTTEAVVRSLPDLEVTHPLPTAPWFEPGASWSARTVLLHLIGETAQHAGHADIIRETMDGAKTMG